MVEEGRKLCLVEAQLELVEEVLLQVQMQLMEEMEHREALAAEAVLEAGADTHTKTLILLFLVQEEMGASVQQEVMVEGAAKAAMEATLGMLAAIVQE